ncbi:TPA: hypothetical protein JBH59_02825 [Legionella pneumophila]|nr:hypothetical protein [Legionella pneumophila]HAU0908744.1 hypothetical protein [Legionella pneumophila]HAU1359115.1 hypothetical protein [Legionella pneumophila]HAU1458280.1 hypothetical protein [Legionella pneumophila]
MLLHFNLEDTGWIGILLQSRDVAPAGFKYDLFMTCPFLSRLIGVSKRVGCWVMSSGFFTLKKGNSQARCA